MLLPTPPAAPASPVMDTLSMDVHRQQQSPGRSSSEKTKLQSYSSSWEMFSPGHAARPVFKAGSGAREGSGQYWNTNTQYQSHQDLMEHQDFLYSIQTRLNFIGLIHIMVQNQELELY